MPDDFVRPVRNENLSILAPGRNNVENINENLFRRYFVLNVEGAGDERNQSIFSGYMTSLDSKLAERGSVAVPVANGRNEFFGGALEFLRLNGPEIVLQEEHRVFGVTTPRLTRQGVTISEFSGFAETLQNVTSGVFPEDLRSFFRSGTDAELFSLGVRATEAWTRTANLPQQAREEAVRDVLRRGPPPLNISEQPAPSQVIPPSASGPTRSSSESSAQQEEIEEEYDLIAAVSSFRGLDETDPQRMRTGPQAWQFRSGQLIQARGMQALAETLRQDPEMGSAFAAFFNNPDGIGQDFMERTMQPFDPNTPQNYAVSFMNISNTLRGIYQRMESEDETIAATARAEYSELMTQLRSDPELAYNRLAIMGRFSEITQFQITYDAAKEKVNELGGRIEGFFGFSVTELLENSHVDPAFIGAVFHRSQEPIMREYLRAAREMGGNSLSIGSGGQITDTLSMFMSLFNNGGGQPSFDQLALAMVWAQDRASGLADLTGTPDNPETGWPGSMPANSTPPTAQQVAEMLRNLLEGGEEEYAGVDRMPNEPSPTVAVRSNPISPA